MGFDWKRKTNMFCWANSPDQEKRITNDKSIETTYWRHKEGCEYLHTLCISMVRILFLHVYWMLLLKR